MCCNQPREIARDYPIASGYGTSAPLCGQSSSLALQPYWYDSERRHRAGQRPHQDCLVRVEVVLSRVPKLRPPRRPSRFSCRSVLAGKAHGTPNLSWKCRRHGLVAPSGSGAAPRRANLRDQLATSVPRIHPRFCPIPAHQVPRAASRAKLAPFPTSSSRPNADLRPSGGPGRGLGPARCGFSTALRCICAPMARSGVRLRRVDCGAPR